MNRLLPILVLFSLFFAGPSSAAPIDWPGMDQFQRGNRITPSHMNDIIDALDSVKTEVDALTVGGSDSIRVNNNVPTIANSIFDLRDGDGINITLGENSPAGTDSATFDINLYGTGPGLVADGTGLSLLRTCSDDDVLQWDTTNGWECQPMTGGGGGGTDVRINTASVSNPNFNSTTPAAGAGVINIPFAVSTSDVAIQLTLNNITDVGTLTEAVTIQGALTLSDTSASLQFTEANGSLSCSAGDGAVGWSGSVLQKCEDGTVTTIAGREEVDPILIDSDAVTDSAGVNFLGGDGVTVTHAGGGSPDTATVAVDLNAILDGDGSTSNLSGLEFTATNELALLQGCANDEVLVWQETGGTWNCGSRVSGSSAVTVDGGTTIATADLRDTSTVHVTNSSGTVTFDVIGTAINELGTLTNQIVTDELGVRFTEEGAEFTNCTTDFPSSGGIFYDDNVLKKCENGTLTDLAPDVNNITGSMNITGTTTDATNLLELIPSVDGGGSGAAGQPAFRIFGFDPQTGGAGSSVNITDPIFDVYHNGVVNVTNNLNGGPRGLSPNWTILPSGIARFQSIQDTDGPGTNFSITSAGAATFADALTVGNGMGVTAGAVTIGGTAAGIDTDVQIGGDLTAAIDGVLTITTGNNERLLVLEPFGGAPSASTVMEVQDGASTGVFRIRKDGYVTAQRIGDIDGPGTNWRIDEDGTSTFNNTTVEDLTSTGTLAHSGGTATLSSGASDSVIIGDSAAANGKVRIGGNDNEPQLVIQGHSTQGDSIVIVQNHASAEVFNVNDDGAVYAQSINDIDTGSSNWSIASGGAADFGNTTVGGNLVTTGETDTDTLDVGDVTTTDGKVTVGGEADEVQLVVQGHSGQTNDVVVVENNGGADLLTLNNSGVLEVQSVRDIDTGSSNWSIAANGTAVFGATTVGSLQSTGTFITQLDGNALFAASDGNQFTVGNDVLGGGGSGGKVEIGATTDQPQLMVKGHSTQTDSIVIVQNGATPSAEVFNVNADGAVYSQSVRDMEWCEDLYNNVTGAQQESGIPDGICDSDGSTLQTGKWNVTDKGRASFADLSFNSCADVNGVGDSGIPQTTGASDGLCDDDGITPANGRLVFNDAGFDGTTDYVAADGAGAGENVGALAARDGFITTNCISEDSYSSFGVATETGCDMTLASGRRAGASAAPHITLKDGVSLPDNALEAPVTQIEIGAPIVPLNAVGSTAEIAMGGSPISGAIKITNVSGGSNVGESQMVNQWFFITNGGGTISLSTLTQVGRSGCFYASSAHEFTIQTEDDGTGSHIFLNGQQYVDGATTSPSITSSGSQGDFVCLLSANPNNDADYEWYVLGQSGTFIGADGS